MFSYENDPDLFNFDYKNDLHDHARLRERVFTLNQFAPKLDEEGNLLNQSKDNGAYASNATTGTNKAYDSGASPAKPFNSSGFGEEEISKPEKTSYPEDDVLGRF